MLKFEVNKDKTDANFEVSECITGDVRLTIIKGKKSGFVSVFARRDVFDENRNKEWYIEIWDHSPTSYTDAKRLAEKLLDIVLWYKPLTHEKDSRS